MAVGISVASGQDGSVESDIAGDEEVRADVDYVTFERPEPIIEGIDYDRRVGDSDGSSGDGYDRLSRDILDYQENVDLLEAEQGPWHQALTQELTAMGSLYMRQGAYLEAIDVFDRAMHISRVNHGLDNQQQIPVVENLINSHIAAGQWDMADKFQSYLFYTQKNAFGAADPRMIPVLERLGTWNLRMFNMRFGEAVGLRLTDAYRLFVAASDITSRHFGHDDERVITYLQGAADTAYLIATNYDLVEIARQPEFRTVERWLQDELGEIEPISVEGYREGLEALQNVVELLADREEKREEYFRAQVAVADWYLLFNRNRAATRYYEEAFQFAQGLEGGAELIREAFADVTPLPVVSSTINAAQELYITDVAAKSSGRFGVAEIEFDVTAFGTANKITVLTEETKANSSVLALLRRQVRETVYRPRVVDGKPVKSESVKFRYRYRY